MGIWDTSTKITEVEYLALSFFDWTLFFCWTGSSVSLSHLLDPKFTTHRTEVSGTRIESTIRQRGLSVFTNTWGKARWPSGHGKGMTELIIPEYYLDMSCSGWLYHKKKYSQNWQEPGSE